MSTRFSKAAAQAFRDAIREADGVEVFAIGTMFEGEVGEVVVSCRGTEDAVPALIERPRAGQIVVHNHPSGDLRPSDADFQLAQLYGENGVGVVIVDNDVAKAHWVVEPHVQKRFPVDLDRLATFFTTGLASAIDGYEPRPQQVEMALAVAQSFDDEIPVLCEAGTGTGKSLAYLVPAALWALANDGRVIVSTYTKALQAQLVGSDLPLLTRGGIEARTAVLEGRNNYLCKRRMGLADLEADAVEKEELAPLFGWSEATQSGSRSEIPFPLDGDLWERVMSDSELSLSVKCPHYAKCHYYVARRAAASAHVLVVNHALLLTDLSLRASFGRGILPKPDRIVIDEAHHLEDAATSVATSKLTGAAVRRAVATLCDRPRRRGALSRVLQVRVPPDRAEALARTAGEAHELALSAEAAAQEVLHQVAESLLVGDQTTRRIRSFDGEDKQLNELASLVTHLSGELTAAATAIDAVSAVFEGVPLTEASAQPVLDLRRAGRRLAEQAATASAFLSAEEDQVRWVSAERATEGLRTSSINAAPIEVAAVVRRILWRPFAGVAATSATLTVGSHFGHFSRRTGLPPSPPALELVIPSPFDHASQALLGLPRDLPVPDDPGFGAATAAVVVECIAISDGGAFVLCTSHAAVKEYAAAIRKHGGNRPVLAQGEAGRAVLLDRFRRDRRSVLVGTDTFWEGISVRGDGLRLVVIPRLPFRVPTDPLTEARHERVAARGGDAFKTLALPDAVLKLKQGYGRLIRAHSDRGAVVMLDRRIHDRSYGTLMLRSLPPARRITGPWRRVKEELSAFFTALGKAGPPDSGFDGDSGFDRAGGLG